jgi:hypothetical protein
VVWLWLIVGVGVEEFERFGLDRVGVGEAGEGVFAVADAELVAADGAELGDQVGEVVGG